ncbi:MAG TPA: LuxR C-terminal-related transcriptional regulator [Planctomycetota bacterium]|nr:LuxR C-terminal-related transcriptional regulator [Planctomycetota bacterium]
MLAAAEAAYVAGRPRRARALLEAATVEGATTEVAAQIHRLHGWLDITEGKFLHAHERLLTEGAALGDADAALAADLYADAGLAAAIGGEPAQARAAARRARELAAGSGSQATIDLRAGVTMLLAGDGRAGERLIRRALAEAREGELARGPFRSDILALYWTEQYGVAAEVLDRLIEHGRRSRDRLLAGWIDTRAAIDFRLGRWSAAEARAAEARRLAEALGQTPQVASCLATLARISAARGRAAECRRRLEQAAALMAGSEDVLFGWTRSAAGLLELGLGDVERAVDALEPLVASEVGRATLDPAIGQATSDLIEAYVRGGRVSEGRSLCEEFERRVRGSGRAWAAAALHRCRGLLAPPSAFDDEFAEALRHHRRTATPFELARTELCYGERLRRARRRRDAGTHLRSALGTFVQLGTAPWAERARRELAATRGRTRGESDGLRARLTPHELRVVALVERGLRNREIAATLFVSERTVEYHLTNVYGKLDVRSRTELAWLLGRAGELPLETGDAA